MRREAAPWGEYQHQNEVVEYEDLVSKLPQTHLLPHLGPTLHFPHLTTSMHSHPIQPFLLNPHNSTVIRPYPVQRYNNSTLPKIPISALVPCSPSPHPTPPHPTVSAPPHPPGPHSPFCTWRPPSWTSSGRIGTRCVCRGSQPGPSRSLPVGKKRISHRCVWFLHDSLNALRLSSPSRLMKIFFPSDLKASPIGLCRPTAPLS